MCNISSSHLLSKVTTARGRQCLVVITAVLVVPTIPVRASMSETGWTHGVPVSQTQKVKRDSSSLQRCHVFNLMPLVEIQSLLRAQCGNPIQGMDWSLIREQPPLPSPGNLDRFGTQWRYAWRDNISSNEVTVVRYGNMINFL